MTVSILRQLQRRRCTSDFTNVDHGCPVQETKHFIYKEGTQVYTQRRLTGCLNRWNPSSDNSLAEIDLSPLSSTAVQHSKSPESSQQRPVEAMVDTYTWVEMVSVKSCQKPSVVSWLQLCGVIYFILHIHLNLIWKNNRNFLNTENGILRIHWGFFFEWCNNITTFLPILAIMSSAIRSVWRLIEFDLANIATFM